MKGAKIINNWGLVGVSAGLFTREIADGMFKLDYGSERESVECYVE